MEELECTHSWMQDADKVPTRISTGSSELDATGIAMALNETGQRADEALAVFNVTLQFFNKLLCTLDEAQRGRVLDTLDKGAARQVLMLDYAKKLENAELSGLVDAMLRAQD